MEKIIGLIDAPFTPFYENGDINLEPIPAYAKMLQKNGLKGVFINGSSGEGYMLTHRACGKLLCSREPQACRTRSKDWCLGHRSYGASVPENRSNRGTREVL